MNAAESWRSVRTTAGSEVIGMGCAAAAERLKYVVPDHASVIAAVPSDVAYADSPRAPLRYGVSSGLSDPGGFECP
jgi:hypothetical protein